MDADRELATSRLITRKELSILSIAVGGALLLCWVIRAHSTNQAFAAPMPGQHLAEVKIFQVFSEDFFNVTSELPIPKPAGFLACDFTLRVLAASGGVIESRSVTSLASETFSHSASKLQIFYVGEPIFLSAGIYRVEIDNRADTPAFQARGAKLRLVPQTTGESAVTPLLLLSGVVFLALGLLFTTGPLLLSRRRSTTRVAQVRKVR